MNIQLAITIPIYLGVYDIKDTKTGPGRMLPFFLMEDKIIGVPNISCSDPRPNIEFNQIGHVGYKRFKCQKDGEVPKSWYLQAVEKVKRTFSEKSDTGNVYILLSGRKYFEKGTECFSDSLHHLPTKGSMQTTLSTSQLVVKWGPKTVAIPRTGNMPTRKKRWAPSPVPKCIVQVIPVIGTGAAWCDFTGMDDSINKRIDERYNSLKETIEKLDNNTHNEIESNKYNLKRMRNDFLKASADIKSLQGGVDAFVKQMSETVEEWSNDVTKISDEQKKLESSLEYLNAKVIRNEVLSRTQNALHEILFVSRFKACSEWQGIKELSLATYQSIFNTITTIHLKIDGVESGLHQFGHALSKYLSNQERSNKDILRFSEGEIKIDASLENETTIGISKVNSIMKENMNDMFKSLGHHKTAVKISWFGLIVGLAGIALVFLLLRSADNWRIYLVLFMGINSLWFIAQALASIFSWLSWFI